MSALPQRIDEAPDWSPSDNARIAHLATLPPISYDRIREAEAKTMGIRVGTLDRAVEEKRSHSEVAEGKGRALDPPKPEPWPEPVDGTALLQQMAAAIRRHVVLDEQQSVTCVLWVLMSHALDALTIAPRLAIQSAEKGSGKSTLLDALAHLVPRPLPASNVTPSAIFRVVEAMQPTLLLDEADTFIRGDHEDLRGILNSGHRRSLAFVVRVVGEDHEPRKFSTWAAIAFAGIGKLPDTLQDRSVVIELKRARPDERVEPFRADRTQALTTLARKAARWAADHLEALRGADPDMPGSLFNRQADNWRPLLAIADLAGGAWPQRARDAAQAIASAPEEDSHRTRLLADIRTIFTERAVDRLASAELAAALVTIEGAPWAEWGRSAKPLSANGLARLLKPFGIAPDTIRLPTTTAKGYYVKAFEDTFSRYLPCTTVTPSQGAEIQASPAETQPSQEGGCYGSELPANPQNSAPCDGVTVGNPVELEL